MNAYQPLILAFGLFFGMLTAIMAYQIREARQHNRLAFDSMRASLVWLRVVYIASLISMLGAFATLIFISIEDKI